METAVIEEKDECVAITKQQIDKWNYMYKCGGEQDEARRIKGRLVWTIWYFFHFGLGDTDTMDYYGDWMRKKNFAHAPAKFIWELYEENRLLNRVGDFYYPKTLHFNSLSFKPLDRTKSARRIGA